MEPEGRQLDPDARAALEAAGERLLGGLAGMRGGVEQAAWDELPPEAKAALERRGDDFLDELERRRRASQGSPVPRYPVLRLWGARLAKLAALGLAVAMALKIALPPPPDPAPEPPQVASAELPIHGYSPVPEPGTGALTLVGALLLAMRRRRPC